jgi:hypothetical protein
MLQKLRKHSPAQGVSMGAVYVFGTPDRWILNHWGRFLQVLAAQIELIPTFRQPLHEMVQPFRRGLMKINIILQD